MVEHEQTPAPAEPVDPFAQIMAEVDAIEVEPEPAEPAAAPEGTQPSTDPAPDPAAAAAAPAPVEPAATATDAASEAPEPPAAPPATPPAEPTPTPETESVPFTFKVDGREVTIAGAREDGENIVIPKPVWHSEVKNYLADRAAFGRREAQLQQQLRQVQEAKGQNETLYGSLLEGLKKIAELPEAESFDEWERFRASFKDQLAKAEADYWKAQATSHQQQEQQEAYQAEAKRYAEDIRTGLRHLVDSALRLDDPEIQEVVSQLEPEEAKALAERIYERILVEADAGYILLPTGETLADRMGLPKVEPNYQRIAAVVKGEVGVARGTLARIAAMKKQLAAIEAAAKANAQAEATRRSATPAPPPVSTKAAPPEAGKPREPRSWDDIMAEVDSL